jgi:hypothetical protein
VLLSSISLSACVGNDIPPRPIEAPVPTSCDAGPCPVELVSAPRCLDHTKGGIHLVVVDGTLFWTNKHAGTVNRIPTMGGSITVLASGRPSPGPLAVDETSIFWVDGNKTIMKMPRDGGPPKLVVAATTVPEIDLTENDINGLLVDHGTLFFGRFISAFRVSTSGGTPTEIGRSADNHQLPKKTPDNGKPTAFAIDVTHLYQTEDTHDAVTREALDGTQNGLLEDRMTRVKLAPDRIGVSLGSLLLDAIAVVNGNVIWADGELIESEPVGALENDAIFHIAATSQSTSVTGFVVSGDTIFLGEADFNKVNLVEKVPLSAPQSAPLGAGATDAGDADGGAADADAPATPVVIATDQLSPSQFAADATNIYWRTDDCKIMRLAK